MNLRKEKPRCRRFLFGYKCQECGKGTVREQIFHGYKTKLKGLPLTVDDARIGVCDLVWGTPFRSKRNDALEDSTRR